MLVNVFRSWALHVFTALDFFTTECCVMFTYSAFRKRPHKLNVTVSFTQSHIT